MGLEGVEGVEGLEGVEGVEGLEGVEGVEGLEGVEGVEGLEGVEGVEGLEGVEGVEGLEGVEGVEGLEGVEGVEGVGLAFVGAAVGPTVNLFAGASHKVPPSDIIAFCSLLCKPSSTLSFFSHAFLLSYSRKVPVKSIEFLALALFSNNVRKTSSFKYFSF